MTNPAPVSPSPEGVPGAVTDPARVRGQDITYPGSGGDPINGYLVQPAELDSEHGRPAVIVIHEAGGLGEHIRDVSNRFANLGYIALGVDLYTREGGPPPMDDLQALMARLFAMSDATVLGDLEGAADLLRAHEDCNGKVGCIGFCMGGRYTLLFACSPQRGCEPNGECLPASANRLDAAVDCWGRRWSWPSSCRARCTLRSEPKTRTHRLRSASSCASAPAGVGRR